MKEKRVSDYFSVVSTAEKALRYLRPQIQPQTSGRWSAREEVRIQEVKEETGLDAIPLSTKIYGIESLPTIGHIKRGKYISAHIHLDAIFLLQADDTKSLSYREDESKGVKWIPIEEAYNKDIVDFIRPVNKKIIQKLGINITK